MKKYGIDKLKMAVLWGIVMADQLDKSLEDGKFRWFEAFGFVDELQALAELIPFLEEMGDEFKDLDTEEKNELIEFIGKEFSLDREWAEKITQTSLDAAVSTYLSIKTWRDFKKSRKS